MLGVEEVGTGLALFKEPGSSLRFSRAEGVGYSRWGNQRIYCDLQNKPEWVGRQELPLP